MTINKDDFEAMLKDWLADSNGEYDDLIIDFETIRRDEDDGDWIADAHDDACAYYLRQQDGDVYIVYAGVK